MKLIGNDGLSAFVNMHMPNRLLAWLVQLSQRFQRRTAIALSLQRQPPGALSSGDIFAHVDGCMPGKLSKLFVVRSLGHLVALISGVLDSSGGFV